MNINRKCLSPVYTFVLERFNDSNIVCQVEASSKTNAINYLTISGNKLNKRDFHNWKNGKIRVIILSDI